MGADPCGLDCGEELLTLMADLLPGPKHTFQLVLLAVPFPLILEIPMAAWGVLHFAEVLTLSRRPR